MILVTGAGGKTGLAVLRQLAGRAKHTRALVRSENQIQIAIECGAAEALVGDLLNQHSIAPAFEGIMAIYHIPPNMHPGEVTIAENVLRLADGNKVGHFVYHSVLRPYIRAMPHHLNKALVEERLFTTDLPFTILQPAAYMQNTISWVESGRKEGLFSVPYPVHTQLGMVDLKDVVEVAATVIGDPLYFGGTYELVGTEILTPSQIADLIAEALGQPVRAMELDLNQWKRQATRAGLSRYAIRTLLKMFRYYADYGFWGNPHTLASLLGRPPKTYAQFLAELDLRPLK